MRPFALLLAGLLAGPAVGCAPSGGGNAGRIVFPERVAGFVRTTDAEAGRSGTVAGYDYGEPGEPILVTVNVRPLTGASLLPSLDAHGRGDAGAAQALLDRSKAQVRRYYPAADVVSEGEAFLMLEGRLQPGRRARMQFVDILAGRERPIALEIVVLCCDGAQRSYEYRFRFPASLTDELPIAEFKREFRAGG